MIVKKDTLAAIDFGGLAIYDYTAGQATRSSFAVIHVPPGVQHAEAWSKRSDKYYYVAGGLVQFGLDGAETTLCAGDFCLVRQGQRFWYGNQMEETATLILVHTPGFDPAAEVFV